MKYTKEERKARRKAFFAKIKAFFKNLDDTILPKANELALKFMNALKTVSENDGVEFITKLIGGEKGEVILEKAHMIIEKSVIILGLTNECMQEEDLVKKAICIWNKLKDLPREQRAFALNNLHAIALAEFDDNAEEMAIYLAQAPTDYLHQEIV